MNKLFAHAYLVYVEVIVAVLSVLAVISACTSLKH